MKRLLLALLVVLVACHKSEVKGPVGTDESRTVQRNVDRAPVAGWMFTSANERTLGPFHARRAGQAAMATWLTPAEGTFRTIHVVPIDAKGVPHGESIVAKVSLDTTMLAIGALTGPMPGFTIAWTSLTDRGKSLWSAVVDDKGAPRGKPIELTRTTDDIVWIDILPTEHGSICLWAEETRTGGANLIGAPIAGDGRVRGAASRIAQGVTGWHALPLDKGVGVSTVTPGAPDAKPKPGSPVRDAKPGGVLAFRRLDAEGQPLVPPVVITPKSATVSGDVEVVRANGRLLFAWTDRSGGEPGVALASLDDRDNLDPARRVVDARGGAALVSIAANTDGAAILFEAPSRRSGESRRVHLARVNDGLSVERRPLNLEVVGRGQPELAATANGFAVLATTADCDPEAASCANAKAVATVYRTDARAAVVQREPLAFGADPATLGWGLSCETDTCFALAASPGTPTRIRSATVRPREGARPVEAKTPDAVAKKDGTHVVDVTAVASGESVADLATARFGTSTLVALLSGRAERGDRSSAALSTRLVSDEGEAGPANVIAPRAVAVGGVSVAPAGGPDDGGALAWVSRESGDAEVHVTRLDKRGRRTGDVQLTTARGEAGDVTITWVGNGWLVAWVDWRDGNGEVYAAKVGLDLSRAGREERITKAPGDALDLAALAVGENVWLAWGDTRESPREGLAEMYTAAVRGKDAKKILDEQRLLATAANSRTPSLAATADGVAIAWIEDAPLGAETPGSSGYGAFLARLSADGKPSGRPQRLALAGDGAATSVALLRDAPLRAIVARGTLEGLALDAIDVTKPAATTVLGLDGPPSLDVSLATEGDVVFFNDEGTTVADRRARRAHISWR